jgi:hypothetical protein
MSEPQRLDRSGFEVEVDEGFDGDELDPRLWTPFYVSHWSSRAATKARYDILNGQLRLRIEADQKPWSPEFDGDIVVSCLQTGAFAGPVGSSIGQLHFRDGLVVREAQPNLRLYTPQYGLFEIKMRAIDDPANMVALWMMGYEDRPECSGEILIAEMFGRDVDRDEAGVGMGIRPFADPSLRDEFEAIPIPIDALGAHWYAAKWTPDGVEFYVDEVLVKASELSPSYPMQFMLAIYEFRDGPNLPSLPDHYPKTFVVEQFRGCRPTTGPGARDAAFPVA